MKRPSIAPRAIPGVTSAATTDLPVLHSFKAVYSAPGELGFSRWLASLPPWSLFLLVAAAGLWPLSALAQNGGFTTGQAFEAHAERPRIRSALCGQPTRR